MTIPSALTRVSSGNVLSFKKAKTSHRRYGEVRSFPYRHRRVYYSPNALVEKVRRAVDVIVSALVLILAMPIMLIVAGMIRIDSPGPVLFWQKRVGRDRRGHSGRLRIYTGPERRRRDCGGEPFWFLKFRTMHVDARMRFPQYYAYRYTPEQLLQLRFKERDDPRHTNFGRWLRTTSLDELPNFWCVLRGQMTLVGPRPDIPEMVRYYRPAQMHIFDVKPGVTGFAQIRGRCNNKFLQTKRLDLAYVRHRSLLLDLKLLIQTAICMVTNRNAF